MTLAGLAFALNGEVRSGEILSSGPGHSKRDRSLSVRLSPSMPDGLLVHSYAGDDWRQCRDFVRERLKLGDFTPGKPGPVRAPIVKRPADNIEPALRIWAEASDPRATLVVQYLQARRLDLPDEAAVEAIRFHPACPFGQERIAAMVCLVRDIVTNKPQGIHRTALSHDGTAIRRNGKTFRMSLGSLAGGAVKLGADETVTSGLSIGEGVETTIAGMCMGLRPAWSLVSTTGIANFPTLPGIDGLHIFKEHDANGASANAVEACARRWHEFGCTVLIVTPNQGKDLNDEYREAVACQR